MDISQIQTMFSSYGSSLFGIVKNRFDFFNESLKKSGIELDLDAQASSDLVKVLLYSEFVTSTIIKNPYIIKELFESKDLFKSYSEQTYVTRFGEGLLLGKDMLEVQQILLEARLYETIRIAWRDLTGAANLEETLMDLSNLADVVVDLAIRAIYDEISLVSGLPVDSEGNSQGLIVLGMGKLGAKELNFSSDIDLIFVYPKAGYTNGKEMISNEEFFTKVCRKFLKFFSAGSHGINFYRVDTRLRPYGDSGPLVMSAAAFEEYYQAQGREWERYAMIKARPIAGDIEKGFELLKTLNSFIYRRYFDYGSFDSFREMKHRITLQVKSKKLKNNIKLGAGGIREIEFFGQLFQLIRGGVEPDLQERNILRVLQLLVVHQCINDQVQDDLTQAYVFLRMVENRLQAYADLQTHDIPENIDQRKILALSMGYDVWHSFEDALNGHMQKVHHHFKQLLVSEDQGVSDQEIQNLKELWVNITDPQFVGETKLIDGFKDPDRVLNVLRSLQEHPNTKRLTSNGRKKLARLIPVLIRKIGEQENPEAILVQLIDLVITIERRTCYLSLLIEDQGALENLITLAQKSPWIIRFISKHPVLLDELMHPDSLYAPPGKQALEEQMRIRMSAIPLDDLEILLEELSVFRQISMLRVSAADVSGNYPLMKVSDHLTYIAETILAQVLKISWDIVTQKYGVPWGILQEGIDHCGFAIVAYGKVGGLEMGYKSDIDIVFLHRAESGRTKGAPKNIESVRFYSNLGQRIINALTVHTSAGKLYGADLRLRPGGDAGTIVSHIDAFEEYLKDQAWTWEHQALIRARCIAGDTQLCERFGEIRKFILTQKRDAKTLKKDVGDMRERMREDRLKYHKDLFDLKQSRGGIVDIEFLVQYLILKEAYNFPDLIIWTDNMRLLESLNVQGIITGFESQLLQKAYLALRKAIHRLILQEKPLQLPKGQFVDMQNRVMKIYDKYLLD